MTDCLARRVGPLSLVGLLLTLATQSLAGGGPENVMLVVNANSAGSKEVANHYLRLRDLPASNVLYLDYDGPLEKTTGSRFRDEILKPVIEAIESRGLAMQIDMVAYSTDFPWSVNLRDDYPEDLKLSGPRNPTASITGATYLFAYVMGKSPGIVQLNSNWYVPVPPGTNRSTNARQCRKLDATPSRAFRSRYAWKEDGTHADNLKSGQRYLMSTVLGVTTGRGNTVAEVIAALDRAVEAEESPPRGTFYFMKNGNSPRSTPRHGCFAAAADELRRSGANAKVAEGKLPTGAPDVLGIMSGAGSFDLSQASLRIQPGAICEHLTSYGGILSDGMSQTPLSEFIRAGATGSSGTVVEPYAIQAKFPLPTLQVHYRRGCSLAESFYQSVAAPYQLLVVGDPLCQPWAKRPQLDVEGWPTVNEANPTLAESGLGDLSQLGFAELGITPPPKASPQPAEPMIDQPATDPEGAAAEPPVLKLTPRVTASTGSAGGVWELFVDGRLRRRLPSGRETTFTAKELGPGWHDLRCVAINPDSIESQRRQSSGIEVLERLDEPISKVRIKIDSPTVPLDGKVAVSATSSGAERIIIRQHSREVATIDGESGGALIPAEMLGRGNVRLQAIAEPSGAASPMIWTRIE